MFSSCARGHRDKTQEDLCKELSHDLKVKLNEILNYTIEWADIFNIYRFTPFRHWRRTESYGVKDYIKDQDFLREYNKFLDRVHTSLVKCVGFVERGANPNTTASDGRTIMHFLAAAYSKSGADNQRQDFYLKALAEINNNPKTDINKKTSFICGTTPLKDFLHGINNPYPYNVPAEKMFWLLRLGADPNTKDIYGRELTHYVKNNQELIAELSKIRNASQLTIAGPRP